MMRRLSMLVVCSLGWSSIATAEDRKEVATRVGCSITVGDRDDATATDLIVATCPSWPVGIDKMTAVMGTADTHGKIFSSVQSSVTQPDGTVVQVHVASGISDRQATLSFTALTLPDGGYRVSWTMTPKQVALGEGRVGTLVDDGSWAVWDNGDGTTKVEYTLRYGAGGRVPSWLVRSFQKTSVGDILEEMRTHVGG